MCQPLVSPKEQLLEKLEFTSPRLAQQIRRIDAVDGKELTLRNSAVSQIVDDNALDRARHARRRGAFTIVHNEGRLLHFDNHLTMGGIACAMSHRLALQAVVQHPTAAHLDVNTGLTQIPWRHPIWRLFDNVAIQSEGCQALPFIRQMPLYSCRFFTVII